jgi:alpha-D-xyloside xylohydrolase
MSSKGYGIYVNTAAPTRFNMGEWSFISYTMYALTNSLDYFFIYGPEFKDILPEYMNITGIPQLPPKWSFGLWMSKCTYNSQDEVLKIAGKLRANKVPCDVINIDLWHNYDFIFKKEFPDPAGMVERLDADGFVMAYDAGSSTPGTVGIGIGS